MAAVPVLTAVSDARWEAALVAALERKQGTVIEVMLERVTNISMGTEIDAINEFEELATSIDDAPTVLGVLD